MGIEKSRQQADCSRQKTTRHFALGTKTRSHYASLSLGQYAPLSFVVIGRGQKTEGFVVGAAFSRDLTILTTSTALTI